MLAVANDPSTVEVLADLAQVVIGVGAIVSIWIGLASLREVRRERARRVRPWLAFDHGGQYVRCEISTTNGLPGLEPAFIQKIAGASPRDVRKPTSMWGKLRNHGGGVALDAQITFVTRTATVGTETFRVSQDKLDEFPYDLRVNRIPASPSHIHPGEEARFFRVPAPVFERNGDRQVITGLVVIRCRDVLDRSHTRYQRFRAAVEGRIEGEEEGLLITFSDELDPDEARSFLGDLASAVPELLSDEKTEFVAQLGRAIVIAGLGRLPSDEAERTGRPQMPTRSG